MQKSFIIKFTFCITAVFIFIVIFLTHSLIHDVNRQSVKTTEKHYEQKLLKANFTALEEKYKRRRHSRELYAPILIDEPHYKDLSQNTSQLPDFDKPGEYGKPVLLDGLSSEENVIVAAGWQKHAFNEYVSDKISLNRQLPDVRPTGCLNETYSRSLPSTSVIICFHNEALSVLLRTINSVINRTPPHLLEEIILVDDFSELEYLGKELDDKIKSFSKVKLIRAKKREGLIRARLLGAREAKGQILTFLDSHCECAPGWLEPLLQRIYDSWTTVVAPIIDIIDDSTFQYFFREAHAFGVEGFTWDLQFDWRFIPLHEQESRKHVWDPVRSPTLAGGLFAINREYFQALGMYDEGFDIWGAENLELSFKTWMCGGKVEVIPCSHVGHVYRKRNPYSWIPGENSFRKNCIRLAEVWMDDYKHYFYKRMRTDAETVAESKVFGDISGRKELRKSLDCKSFQWYLENVIPEQFIPRDLIAEGQIRNFGGDRNRCLEGKAKADDVGSKVWMSTCLLGSDYQYFMLTSFGEIRRDQMCLDLIDGELVIYFCDGNGNQVWGYHHESRVIFHEASGKCLEMTDDRDRVVLEECMVSPWQVWTLENLDTSQLVQIDE